MSFMMNATQARAARAMLRLTVAATAKLADVSPNTLVRIEGDKPVNTTSVKAAQAALQAAGIEFLPDGGVRLREPQA